MNISDFSSPINVGFGPLAKAARLWTHVRRLLVLHAIVLVGLGCENPNAYTPTGTPAIAFAMRIAEETPTAGTTPTAMPAGSVPATIYVYPTNELVTADIARAEVGQEAGSAWKINVECTPQGSAKLSQASRAAQGKRLAFFMNNRLVSAPRVHAVMDGGKFELAGFKEEEARAIAKGLVGRQ
jgi:hypothetical protein